MMATNVHPSSIDLEAFAVGEPSASVEAHLASCAACAAFVERLRGAVSTGPSRARAADAVARAAARLEAVPVPPAAATAGRASAEARRRWWLRASTVAAPLAAAAALLVLLRSPSTKDALAPAPPGSAEAPAAPQREPETRFKGGMQVAVVREREGAQVRFTGSMPVKPGDRLRVEVALDREQAILAAVLGDDGSWLELMSEGTRPPGTHFSERSARVDASPLRGTILVGPPAAVRQARQTRRFEDVTAVPIEWDGP